MSKTNELMQIGLRLSNCRQDRNMTQEELAGRLGITPQAVSKWERGASLPDISMLADLAALLHVSTDWLLGIRGEQAPEAKGNASADRDKPDFIQGIQPELGNCLRESLQPLELVFGTDLTPAFMEYNPKLLVRIQNLRLELAREEGILMPVLRVRDHLHPAIGKMEFMILSFHTVLYSQVLDTVDQGTVEYIIGKAADTMRGKYHEILYPDLMKSIVDNLKVRYPALIEDMVPERISYGLLTEAVKPVLAKGNSIRYLPKMIEIMECALRRNPAGDAQYLAEQVLEGIQRKDNFYVFLNRRQAPNA